MGLMHQFTSYRLQQASSSVNLLWRLLELLMRFESSGWAEYSIEDFATSRDATEKQRGDFHDIKRRIIEPAMEEVKKRIEMAARSRMPRSRLARLSTRR
jgi:hypothetical protein